MNVGFQGRTDDEISDLFRTTSGIKRPLSTSYSSVSNITNGVRLYWRKKSFGLSELKIT